MSTDSSFDNVNPAETYLNVKTESTLAAVQDILFRDGKLALVRDTGKIYRLIRGTPGDIGNWHFFAEEGGGGTGGGFEFVFTPGALHSGNVYGDWTELGAAIAALLPGEQPTVTFTDTFTIPGPIDMRGGTWRSITRQTGAVLIFIPDGIVIDNLHAITDGIAVICFPTTADGVFTFSTTPPPGSVKVFAIFNGAVLGSLGTKALIAMAGGGDFLVYAVSTSPRIAFPPDTAPIVLAGPGDTVIGANGVSAFPGELPDGWVVGGAGGILQYQLAISSTLPSTPGWLGTTPVTLQTARIQNLPVSATFVVKPGIAIPNTGNQFADFASAWAAAASIPGPKVMQFDDNGGPINIGPGVYDATDWTFEGVLRGGASNVTVNLLEGAQFDPPPTLLRYGITLFGQATATPNILLRDSGVIVLEYGGAIQKDPLATAPVMQIDPGVGPDGPFILGSIGSQLGSGNNDIEILASVNGATVILDVLATLPNESFFGAGFLNVLVSNVSALTGITLPPTQSGLATFQMLDLTISGLGVRQYWSCESAPLPGTTDFVPPGYALTTTTFPMGVRALRNELMNQLIMTYVGDVLNVGLTVLVELQVSVSGGPVTPIPGASFVIDASLPGASGFAAFNAGASAGTDLILLTMTPSAPLIAPITQINISLG